MAYTPINWQTGDTITAEKMNKMDNGWSVDSSQLFSETVTTAVVQTQPAPVGALNYNTQITSNTLIVTFNGDSYNLPLASLEWGNLYGEVGQSGPVFTTYPVCILSNESGDNSVYTETAGTYTVSAYVPSVEVSDAFKTAVNNAAPLPMLCVSGVTTYDEMIAAKNAKRLLYFWTENEGYGCYIIKTVDSPCNINPPTASVVANFDNNNVLVITEQ